MGRSINYPAGAIVAYRALECENDDDWEWEWVYEGLMEFVILSASDAFPSLEKYEGWHGREDRILFRNAYADFGISVSPYMARSLLSG